MSNNNIENVALVVPVDSANGPESYNINPDAEVTVLIYRGGKVEANHALAVGQLNDSAVKSIVADTGKILK